LCYQVCCKVKYFRVHWNKIRFSNTSGCFSYIYCGSCHRRAFQAFAIGPLHDPVTWCKITHAGEQVAQWDFQNKGRSRLTGMSCIVLEVHCATCSPACVILYHVTGSCKGPIPLLFDGKWPDCVRCLTFPGKIVMCQSSVEWNEFCCVPSSTGCNSLIFVYRVTVHFIQSPFLWVNIPQQLALQSEFLMLRTFFFSLWVIVRLSSWRIGHVNFSRRTGDLRSNLVASSKILVAMATKMVTTWRVVIALVYDDIDHSADLINQFVRWAGQNRMNSNSTKCKELITYKKWHTAEVYNSILGITQTSTVTILGLTFQPNCKFSTHLKESYVKLINACMSSDASEKKDVAKQK